MIVGHDILKKPLIKLGKTENLKNSTYDLTIGDIFLTHESATNDDGERPKFYFLRPRETVFVMSKEEFCLPSTVTGLATLRTSYTKQGILALNVGIIDPFYNGPIGTALINFSDTARPIKVGEKFLRIAFFEHDDVTEFKPKVDESRTREQYVDDLRNVCHSEFTQSFLNMPDYDKFLQEEVLKALIKGIMKRKKTIGAVVAGLIAIPAMLYAAMVFFHDHLHSAYTENVPADQTQTHEPGSSSSNEDTGAVGNADSDAGDGT